jgi:invasion protein IalB
MVNMRLSLIALISLLAAMLPAHAEVEAISTHGDWSIECDTQAPKPNSNPNTGQCALVTRVMDDAHDNIQLDVYVWHVAENTPPVLQIRAPLGVLLTSGLGLKIDGKDIGSAGFVRCLPEGCFVEMTMDETLVNQFLAGQDALFIVFRSPDEGIGIPVSMTGFKQGYDGLTRKNHS